MDFKRYVMFSGLIDKEGLKITSSEKRRVVIELIFYLSYFFLLIRYDDLTYLGRIVSVKVKNMKYRLPQIILCNSSTFRGKCIGSQGQYTDKK
jgi:hypothetical protein